jgi:hypothetical protein
MPACPNCGRQTLRTKDWACQWCGYPLISRAYKLIDKTFKELQEERSLALKSGETESEAELDLESDLELESEPEPEQKPRPPVKPVTRHRPEPEQRTRPPVRPVPKPRTEPEPEPEPEPEQRPRPPVRPVPRPRPEPEPEPEPEQRPRPLLGPVPRPRPEPEPEPEPELEPEPEAEVEPEPAPVPALKLEAIRDGIEVSVDQMEALYRADKVGAHTKFLGKTVVIRGLVERVFVREHLEIRYIVLTGAGKKVLWSVRCTFDKENSSQLSRLNEGQEVAVRGKYDGYGKNIIFKECVLV